MKIGVLGSGIVGQTLAAGFIKHGYPVMMGTRKPGDQDVRNWVSKTPGASAGTFAEAAGFGELLVLARAQPGRGGGYFARRAGQLRGQNRD